MQLKVLKAFHQSLRGILSLEFLQTLFLLSLKMFSCCGTVSTAVVREFNSAVMQILIQKKNSNSLHWLSANTVFLSQDGKYHCKPKTVINKNVHFKV